MESYVQKRRRIRNYAFKKYGLGLDHPMFHQKYDIPIRRKPEDATNLLVHESDIKEGMDWVQSFFSKFTTYDTQELFVSSKTHWLLSNDFLQLKKPHGMITTLKLNNPETLTILCPIDSPSTSIFELELVHQLIRELIVGLFIMNQIPSLYLGANYDQSTTCHLPPAYKDTLIGQMLIEVDVMMKALWHGAYISQDRRVALNETWKSRLKITDDGKVMSKLPVLYEFQSAGLYDLTKEDGFQDIYAEIPKKLLQPLPPPEDFLTEMENVIITLTLYQKSVQYTNGIFLMDSDYFVAGSRKTALDEPGGYDHASEYIFSVGQVAKTNLTIKPDIKFKVELLKLVGLLVPVFMTLKRQNKIPSIEHLLPPMNQESLLTERTLPPITVGPEFANSAFFQREKYFHMHGGIQIDVETTDPESLPDDLIEIFKRLPLISSEILDAFRRFCGAKDAENYENLEWALQTTAAIGQVSILHALIRVMPVDRMEKQSNDGLSVTHVASLYNHVHVLGMLISMGINVNVRKGMISEPQDLYEKCQGFTPLHLAARAGAVQALSLLLAANADVNARDKNGFAPIHHAAWSNQLHVARLLVMKYNQLELETDNQLRSTPLLLAAQRGAVDTMVCLLDMGAKRGKTDAIGRNCIVLAALEYRHHILDFFIERKFKDMLAWTTLYDMLLSEEALWRFGSVKTIEVLSSNMHHLKAILDAGIPQVMIIVLKEDDIDQQKAILISLTNICHDEDVRMAISSVDPIEVLVERLHSPNEVITTLSSRIVFSICHIAENNKRFGAAGAVEALVGLLLSESEELLLEVTLAVHKLCDHSPENKMLLSSAGGIENFVKLLIRPNVADKLVLSVCSACSMMIANSIKNQSIMVHANGIVALSKLLHSNNVLIQTSGAKILGILATSHRKLINQDVMKPMVAMLKVWDIEARVNGASALWALAGDTLTVQKFTANSIGVKLLINMLLTKNPQLIFYGCRFISALAFEDVDNQNALVKEGGVDALARYILSCDDSEETLYEIIRTIGILCVGAAHTNNIAVQRQITKNDSMKCLLKFVVCEKYSQELRVEVIYTLTCIVLHNEDNLKQLAHYGGFNYAVVIQLMQSGKEFVRIKAGMALSTYAFNRHYFHNELHKAGKIKYSFFEHFLNSTNTYYKCQAAFQMSILANLVENCNPIDITAKGLSFLVAKLETAQKEDDFVIIASLISSLARSTTGIPDGLITLGIVDLLLVKLRSENPQVRSTCASALGYLSFNSKAFRQLLKACRAQPSLFDVLIASLQSNAKISEDFVETFRASKQAGLPVVSLCTSRHLCTSRQLGARVKRSTSKKTAGD
uniref:Uncharacterized protein n=1 Tax=Strigamia maritima TaxID=126957 RepID=T1J8F1_STRMM